MTRSAHPIARLLLVAVLLSLATAATALPPPRDAVGLWQTPVNGGQVRIARCGDALCGTLVTSNNIRTHPGLTDENNSNRGLRSRPVRELPR